MRVLEWRTKSRKYFTRLRRTGRLEQSRLDLWLRQLHQKLSKPVKPKSDEIISDQNPNLPSNLEGEIFLRGVEFCNTLTRAVRSRSVRSLASPRIITKME